VQAQEEEEELAGVLCPEFVVVLLPQEEVSSIHSLNDRSPQHHQQVPQAAILLLLRLLFLWHRFLRAPKFLGKSSSRFKNI
jgi:hypothetical protein